MPTNEPRLSTTDELYVELYHQTEMWRSGWGRNEKISEMDSPRLRRLRDHMLRDADRMLDKTIRYLEHAATMARGSWCSGTAVRVLRAEAEHLRCQSGAYWMRRTPLYEAVIQALQENHNRATWHFQADKALACWGVLP